MLDLFTLSCKILFSVYKSIRLNTFKVIKLNECKFRVVVLQEIAFFRHLIQLNLQLIIKCNENEMVYH